MQDRFTGHSYSEHRLLFREASNDTRDIPQGGKEWKNYQSTDMNVSERSGKMVVTLPETSYGPLPKPHLSGMGYTLEDNEQMHPGIWDFSFEKNGYLIFRVFNVRLRKWEQIALHAPKKEDAAADEPAVAEQPKGKEAVEKPEKEYPILMERVKIDDSDHHFPVIVYATDAEGKRVQLDRGKEQKLTPGTYTFYTINSRRGFPVAVQYWVVDAKTKEPVEKFPTTYHNRANVTIKEGQQLKVRVYPTQGNYNAWFFSLEKGGPSVGFVLPRPYPEVDAQPGAFNGEEQFHNALTSIAFWGMKAEREKPEEAKKIKEAGQDPVHVLGVRKVARDLAKVVVRKREDPEHDAPEDYRGAHHVSFICDTTEKHGVHPGLKKFSEDQLATKFEEQLLFMLKHNSFREDYKGGMSFMKRLDEARKESVMQWPQISRTSTDLFATVVKKLAASTKPPEETEEVEFGKNKFRIPVGDLPRFKNNLRKAILREEMNYDSYWNLDKAQVEKRRAELKELKKLTE